MHGFGEDGALDAAPIEWRGRGSGRTTSRPTHQTATLTCRHIAEGAHTGVNAIFQFHFDQLTGRLALGYPARAIPKSPEGPRHVCFHPNLDVVYSSNEQGGSVTAYRFNRATGALTPFQTVPTLPDGYSERNSCSQIQITPSGSSCMRQPGHNSIAGFRRGRRRRHADAARPDANGRHTAAFSLDPSGKSSTPPGGVGASASVPRQRRHRRAAAAGGLPNRPRPHVGADGGMSSRGAAHYIAPSPAEAEGASKSLGGPAGVSSSGGGLRVRNVLCGVA